MNYVALDFETANPYIGSACQIGFCVFNKHKITYKYSSLIRPKDNYFNWYNTKIHGISKKDVNNKPEFDEVWEKISKYFHNSHILAHNASFDMNVLSHCFLDYKIPFPKMFYSCTYKMSKKAWPGLKSYGLKNLAQILDIKFKHHDALEDAKVCGVIGRKIFKEFNIKKLNDIESEFNLEVGSFIKDWK